MVGGGIFSTLGVVIGIAGAWAWLSFAAAGLVALAAGYSYARLAVHYGEGGGAFTFLREIDAEGFAGSLSWVLIVGYVLTNSVYAFTFGQYLGNVVGLGGWFARAAAVAILLVFAGLNLRGVGEAGGVEVFLVWFKLAVLAGAGRLGPGALEPAAALPRRSTLRPGRRDLRGGVGLHGVRGLPAPDLRLRRDPGRAAHAAARDPLGHRRGDRRSTSPWRWAPPC